MKSPEECRNIEDIREAIDQLDREIIGLIGMRAKYVHAAAQYKTSQSSVRASDRVQKMLQTRRTWAKEEGLFPDMIEELYRSMVNYFINQEMEQWEKGS